MNTEATQDDAPQWAIIELMGHIRYGGRVSKDTQFGTPLLRVDVPQNDDSFASQLVNPSSIYRITMCEESLARAAAKGGQHAPLENWQVRHLLPKSESQSLLNDDDDMFNQDDDD